MISQTALITSPSRVFFSLNFLLLRRDVVFQMLHLVLQVSNLSLNLRLQPVRGAFAGRFDLVVDGEAVAAVGGAVVEVGVETSRPGAGGGAGVLEGWGLRFAAAVVGEDVVETHGWCWGFLDEVAVGGGFARGFWVV